MEHERVDLLNSVGFRWTNALPKAFLQWPCEQTIESSEKVAPPRLKRPRIERVTEPATVEHVQQAVATEADELATLKTPKFSPKPSNRMISSPVNAEPTLATVHKADLRNVVEGLLTGAMSVNDATATLIRIGQL